MSRFEMYSTIDGGSDRVVQGDFQTVMLAIVDELDTRPKAEIQFSRVDLDDPITYFSYCEGEVQVPPV